MILRWLVSWEACGESTAQRGKGGMATSRACVNERQRRELSVYNSDYSPIGKLQDPGFLENESLSGLAAYRFQRLNV